MLVTEDEARAQAIARSLRERRAHVGDVRAGSKDPVALRGADLLVIDARRAPSTDARVAEVRSDVRARWASVATIDYTSLASGDGTVDLRALEGVVSKLAGMDKALTERARKEEEFETGLAPLGPTRTLRALAMAGPTLHVTLEDGALKASVDLADELLVAAFAERGGERWEAWTALARVLGMTDANVVVSRRAHPSAMNIMEPVDQALENAAQERARTPELYAEPVTDEISGLLSERRRSAPSAAPSDAPPAKASTPAKTPVAASTPAPTKSAPASSPPAPATVTTPSIAPAAASFATAPTSPAAPWARPAATSPANNTTASNAPASARASIGGSSTLPPPSSARPSLVQPERPARILSPSRPSFADIPTDPAAPGLLQRMAQTPANDAREAPVTPLAPPAAAPASYAHDDDEDEFEGQGQEYDAGEVTVVADASQLDILRETLGRLDAEPKKRPSTPTMPAPPGPVDGNELEDVTAPGRTSEPDLFTQPTVNANASTLEHTDLEARSGARERLDLAHDSLSESEAPLELSKPKLRVNEGESARPKSAPASKTSAWLVISLLLLASAAVALLYWARMR